MHALDNPLSSLRQSLPNDTVETLGTRSISLGTGSRGLLLDSRPSKRHRWSYAFVTSGNSHHLPIGLTGHSELSAVLDASDNVSDWVLRGSRRIADW